MEYFKLSKSGEREINEDSVGIFTEGDKTVFVLADGLGGHGFGEVASREAAEAVAICLKSNSNKCFDALMADFFQIAHGKLKKMQREVGEESFFKTTMVILGVSPREIIWGSVGDSRIYHFEEKTLIERSMDHSVPQMLASSGRIKEKQIRRHEDRSRLLRVLGDEEESARPHISGLEPRNEGAAFLLCSDGFWDFIDERHMTKALRKAHNPEEWLNTMEKTVVKNGKGCNMDNYSAIGVFL